MNSDEEQFITVDNGGGRQEKVRVNFPSNSKKARETAKQEKPKQEKVVSGNVERRKTSPAGRLARTFLAEDSGSVFGWVFLEVLLPALKKMVSDAVSQGTDHILWGQERPRSSSAARPSFVNYGRFGTGRPVGVDPRPPLSRQARTSHDFSEVVIQTRAEAEDVLDRLRDLINEYRMASVSDLYDLVGLTGEFTDDKWGWIDLRSASIRAVRGGFVLVLPRTEPIT